jgi:hypothetical protein
MTVDGGGELFRRKKAQAQLNRSLIKKQAESSDKDLEDIFLGRRIVNGFGPWGVDATRSN